MSAPPANSAIDILFADWGVPIVLEAASESYDPATDQLTSTVTQTNLSAVSSVVRENPLPETGGLHVELATAFLVRTADLPSGSADQWQLQCGTITYTVISRQHSADGLTVRLLCRKI